MIIWKKKEKSFKIKYIFYKQKIFKAKFDYNSMEAGIRTLRNWHYINSLVMPTYVCFVGIKFLLDSC